jgi:hypothetical protein
MLAAARRRGRPGLTDGRLEVVYEHTCILHVESNSLEQLALYVWLKGVDYEVLDPWELVDHVSVLAGRFARVTAHNGIPPRDKTVWRGAHETLPGMWCLLPGSASYVQSIGAAPDGGQVVGPRARIRGRVAHTTQQESAPVPGRTPRDKRADAANPHRVHVQLHSRPRVVASHGPIDDQAVSTARSWDLTSSSPLRS